jgi:hypothetical protein
MSVLRPCLAYCLVAASLVPATVGAQSRAEEARRATLIQQATQARSRGQWPAGGATAPAGGRHPGDCVGAPRARGGLPGARATQRSRFAGRALYAECTGRARSAGGAAYGDGRRVRRGVARGHGAAGDGDRGDGSGRGAGHDAAGGWRSGRWLRAGAAVLPDAGAEKAAVAASGQEEAEVTETLRAGATRTVRMTVRPVGENSFPVTVGPSRLPDSPSQESSSSTLPWIFTGVGAATVGAGLLLRFVLAEGSRDEVYGICPDAVCSTLSRRADASQHLTAYQNLTNAGITAIAIGAASIVTGLVVFVARPSASGRHARAVPSANGLSITF